MLLENQSRFDVPNEMKVAIALGYVPGWQVLRKFGNNSNVVAGSQDMWPLGTSRVLPTTAAVISVTSSSASDTNGGAGAWTVLIEGLDSDLLEISETVTLAGLTPVLTTKLFYRVNRAYVTAADGTVATNVGNIIGTIGGNAQFICEINEGQTHQTHFTVPSNKVFVIDNYRMSTGRIAGSADIHIRGEIKLNYANSAWRSVSDVYLYQGTFANFTDVTVLPGGTELRQRILSSAATQASSTVSGYLVKNSYLRGTDYGQ